MSIEVLYSFHYLSFLENGLSRAVQIDGELTTRAVKASVALADFAQCLGTK